MDMNPSFSAATGAKQKLEFRDDIAEQVGNLIAEAKKIAVISHRGPDGDTLGTGLGLRLILQKHGKDITNVCIDPIPLSFHYLSGSSEFVTDFEPTDFDLVIAVDAAAKHQTGLHQTKPELFAGVVPFINIDHHISNELFGTINLVDAEACSSTAVVWKLARKLGWSVTPDAATSLLNGLMTDTGSLQHSNATPEAFRIASEMLSAGADLEKIRKNVFATTPVPTLKLLGKILERIEMNTEKIVTSTVFEQDFKATGADPKDASNAVDYLNMVPNAKYALLLTERGGKVKGSFRTQRDEVNVSELAGKFGGGGHVKAAGFTVPGRLQIERRFRIIPEGKEADKATDKHLADSGVSDNKAA